MQHIRTPAAGSSHLLNMLDLIAAILPHVGVSCLLLMLYEIRHSSQQHYHAHSIMVKLWHGNLRSGGPTYMYLNIGPYTPDAACITLLITPASSCGFSSNVLNVCNTIRLICSFCCDPTVGLAKVSARKSAPHLRSSSTAPGPMMGKMPWTIWK